MFRYQQLVDIAIANKCSKFIEIGTHNGNTAKMLLKAGSMVSDYVCYIGYDLFEDFTDELGKVEFHGKVPPKSREEVYNDLIEFAKQENIKCTIVLHKGKTSDTFWNTTTDCSELYDLCFVDGGHSVETIRGDITEALKKASIVVCDDFYPDREDVGCKKIVTEARESFYVMPIVDIVNKQLKIAMAVCPHTAYKWTRFSPILQDIKKHPPKKLITNIDDPVFLRSLEMLANLLKFDITNDPNDDIDYAIIQFDGATEEQARETYNLIKKAKRIAIDGCLGDSLDRVDSIGVKLLKEDGRHPCYPISTDERDGKNITFALWPMDGHDVVLNVKTRNCVPDEEIANNVTINTPNITNWIAPCAPHNKTAIMVSAGPSLKDKDTLRQLKKLYKNKNNLFFCVKHAHDYLIENGIVPFACILLDPRSHVKEFIENPHKDVTYFVATMCHPSTVEQLLEKNAKVIGYNAQVNASNEAFKKFWSKDNLLMIPGGSSSITRGIAMLKTLGFRKFECFAFDSCFREKPDNIEKTHQGLDKTVNVVIENKEYCPDDCSG
jgi:hypothetical protein